MSSKAIARTGAALINRFFFSNPLSSVRTDGGNFVSQISPDASVPVFLTKFQAAVPHINARWDDTVTVKQVASPEGIGFPCGLPSLHFFLHDGYLWSFGSAITVSKRLAPIARDIVLVGVMADGTQSAF